jgi:CMP/dCMP kinase
VASGHPKRDPRAAAQAQTGRAPPNREEEKRIAATPSRQRRSRAVAEAAQLPSPPDVARNQTGNQLPQVEHAGCLRPAIVAIDGPAGSGKSTIGFAVAGHCKFLFFDTGIMYRAVTLAALQRDVAIEDEAGVTALAETIHIDLAAPDVQDGRQTTVLLDGNDVTWTIRTPIVDKYVSPVAAYAGVRAALTVQQRRIAQRYGGGHADNEGIVLVGRDTGTVVAPNAAVKIYMDATAEERARRRHVELAARGQVVAFENVLRDILRRDEIDSGRAVAPLRVAEDAVVVDTTGLSPHAVVAAVLAAIRHRLEEQGC